MVFHCSFSVNFACTFLYITQHHSTYCTFEVTWNDPSNFFYSFVSELLLLLTVELKGQQKSCFFNLL